MLCLWGILRKFNTLGSNSLGWIIMLRWIITGIRRLILFFIMHNISITCLYARINFVEWGPCLCWLLLKLHSFVLCAFTRISPAKSRILEHMAKYHGERMLINHHHQHPPNDSELINYSHPGLSKCLGRRKHNFKGGEIRVKVKSGKSGTITACLFKYLHYVLMKNCQL